MITCPYCGNPAKLSKTSAHIYRGRDYGAVWECRPCGAYVGCRKNSTRAHGTPANEADRTLRKKGHAAFDSLWKEHGWDRNAAYRWLASALRIPESQAHFGMMNGEMLARAVGVAVAKRDEIEAALPSNDFDFEPGW